jgi:hypothetical protein
MTLEQTLRRRIQFFTWFFIVGLVMSGATAIPLNWELDLLVQWFGLAGQSSATATTEPSRWLLTAREALHDVSAKHPLLFYGTDWLAFGHFVVAIAFAGALRDPVRNRWLFDFGLIACVAVIPFAMIFGAVRGIPFWWRLIDCSFGVFGFVPLWFCRKWARLLERQERWAAE